MGTTSVGNRFHSFVSFSVDYMIVFLSVFLFAVKLGGLRSVESSRTTASIFDCHPDTLRSSDSYGSNASDEAGPSSCFVAHASAAVPRPRKRALCPPVDAPARPERLLGHGRSAPRISRLPCYLQRRAFSRPSS